MSNLGSNVKLTVDDSYREEMIDIMTKVFGAIQIHPTKNFIAFQFTDGSTLGTYFTTDNVLSKEKIMQGAWLEFEVDDILAVKTSLSQHNIELFDYHDKDHDYFCLPGGQVFRLSQKPAK